MDRRPTPRLSEEVPSLTAGRLAPSPGGSAPPVRDVAKLDRAYQRLRQDIISGVYRPDERLVEARLTHALEVSRSTLRTILVRLQQDGLVVLEPNRGARVRALSLDEAHDVLHVREVLEGLTAALAATRASTEQVAGLGAVFAEMERALSGGDLIRYSVLNGAFHARVLEVAGSPQTAILVDSLQFPLVKRQFRPVLTQARKTASLGEHRDLLRAIETRDADGAERAARSHIQHIRAALAQQY